MPFVIGLVGIGVIQGAWIPLHGYCPRCLKTIACGDLYLSTQAANAAIAVARGKA